MTSPMKHGSTSLQLIDGQGNFNANGLNAFVKAVKLSECGLSYAVVSIMGPQSSGKSTLMNHLFGTSFKEMDAFKARSQTTQGVWLAKASDIDPCTLVMDLEGTDGRERGEDDTAFEKQSALFALAVSDIVLINMWCHDIGREHAANKPLLKTVFQVMMRLFSPRRTTLLFVIRDKTKSPMEILEPNVRREIQKIWDGVAKPAKYHDTPLSEFFQIEVTALASFEDKEEVFREQVAVLRQRFFNSIAPGGLAGDRRTVVPGSGFPLSSEKIWKVIKENKDLDLPAHKVMVATVRCEEIAIEKFSAFASHEEWKELSENAQTSPVPNFGKRVSALLDRHFTDYDAEANYFDTKVRDAKREFLVARSLELVQPSYLTILGHYRLQAFNKFKQDLELSPTSLPSSLEKEGFAAAVRRCSEECLSKFDQGCADAAVKHAAWDYSSKVREKLRRDIDNHAAVVKSQRIAEITSKFEHRLEDSLGSAAASLLDAATSDTWPSLRRLLTQETEVARACLIEELSGFELQRNEIDAIGSAMIDYGRNIVEKKAREEANQVLIHMKDRFNTVFSHDEDSLPRVWSGDEDIRCITRDARFASLKLLAVLAVLRLEESTEFDTIETTLMTLLGELPDGAQTASSASSASSAVVSSTWENIPAEQTLITPIECKAIWRQFKTETEYTIGQALAAQEAQRRGSNWMPPPWAILAIVVLGFNEFMTVLRNPLYLAMAFVLYLVGKAVWVQLNIGREFEHGMLSGLLSISTKLLPTFMNMMKRLVEEGQRYRNDDEASGVYSEIPLQEYSNDSTSSNITNTKGRIKQRRQPVPVATY